MISKEEIKKLADLVRINIADEEAENLRGEISDILDYVGQVKSITENNKERQNPLLVVKRGQGDVINVMREDENLIESDTHSKNLIAEFPNKERDYLKVKKIL